jgi:hypothetical protein
MKRDDRVVRDWVMGGCSTAVVAAACSLRDSGWSLQEIAAQMQNIQKTAGNESIRAAGLNGGPRVSSLYDHMEAFGESIADVLRQHRSDEIHSN